LSASSAGHCYRKHKYKILGTEIDPIDKKSLFRMRIGDLVHEDIQTALLKYYNDSLIMTEVEVESKKLGVRGFLDIVIIEKQEADLKDIKTSAAYAWTKKFGLKKNREVNSSEKYELQIGTYGLLLEEKLGLRTVNMDLIYYKKDDSSIRFVNVSGDYKKKAQEYWLETAKMCKQDVDKLVPGDEMGVPFESWEWNYCPYRSKCPSPFKKG